MLATLRIRNEHVFIISKLSEPTRDGVAAPIGFWQLILATSFSYLHGRMMRGMAQAGELRVPRFATEENGMANRSPRVDNDAVASLHDSQPYRARAVDREFSGFANWRMAVDRVRPQIISV